MKLKVVKYKKMTKIVLPLCSFKIMNLLIIQIKLASHNALKCNVCKNTNINSIELYLTKPFEKSHDTRFSDYGSVNNDTHDLVKIPTVVL